MSEPTNLQPGYLKYGPLYSPFSTESDQEDSITVTDQPVTEPDLWGSPNEFDALFEQAGAAYGVDPRLLRAQAFVESRFNPQAVSPAGAQGIMQFMPQTAQAMGVDPMNPESAIMGAGQYMQELYGRFQDPWKAAAAYNMGPTALSRMGGDFSQVPETMNYVQQLQGMVPDPMFHQFGGQIGAMDAPGPPPPMQAPSTGPQVQQPQVPTQQPPQGVPQPQAPTPQQPDFIDQYLQQQLAGTQEGQAAPTGFIQTIRNAYQQDPQFFYMVLAELARGNTTGIQQLVQNKQAMQQQREQAALQVAAQRERREQTQQIKQETTEQRQVYRVRGKLRDQGLLAEYEAEHGPIQDGQSAAAAESFLSERVGEEKQQKEKLSFYKQLYRNPDIVLSGKLKRWYDQDPEFRQSVDNIREEVFRRRRARQAEEQQEKQLRDERLKAAKQASAKLPPHKQKRMQWLQTQYRTLSTEYRGLMDAYTGIPMLETLARYSDDMKAQLDAAKKRQAELADRLFNIEDEMNKLTVEGGVAPPTGEAPPSASASVGGQGELTLEDLGMMEQSIAESLGAE